MTSSTADLAPFANQDWDDLERFLDDRLAIAPGLLGLALIEVNASDVAAAPRRLAAHLDAEDHSARTDDNRFVIVRCPLTGPAEMEGLGLRMAEDFPESTAAAGAIRRATVHIGVVTGRRGDSAATLLRHAAFGLDDAKMIGRAMVAVDGAFG